MNKTVKFGETIVFHHYCNYLRGTVCIKRPGHSPAHYTPEEVRGQVSLLREYSDILGNPKDCGFARQANILELLADDIEGKNNYIHPDVREVGKNPNEELCTIVVVVKEENKDDIVDKIEQHGGEIDRSLPNGVIIASVMDTKLSEIWLSTKIESISFDGEMEAFN